MRFFRHAEHALVLGGMSLIDGAERRDERWGEIILFSSKVAHWKPSMASRVIGSRLWWGDQYLGTIACNAPSLERLLLPSASPMPSAQPTSLGIGIYPIRKLCRIVLVAVVQSAEWTAADRPFGIDQQRKLLKYMFWKHLSQPRGLYHRRQRSGAGC